MKFDHSEGLQEENTADSKDGFGVPPLPEKHYGAIKDISVYGMSLQGSSHIERNQPCQDYSDFRFIPEADLLICAISDGVGSCALSHWGSYTVVTTVLDVLETELKAELQTKSFTGIEAKIVGGILRKAFSESKAAVEDLADHLIQPVPNFYSTLTAAIYDGSMLYYGHVGDDGIVAQLENGTYQLVTTRHKGEEANSVNPLQAGSPDQLWQFGRVSEPVVGFLMSTDGVLDQYVANQKRNNRVFYPFLENALYCMIGQEETESGNAAQAAFEHMKQVLDQPEYRSKVTDDITVLAAVNTRRLKAAPHPAFSVEDWKEEEDEYRREIQKKLYSGEPAGRRKPPESAGRGTPGEPGGHRNPSESMGRRNLSGPSGYGKPSESIGRRTQSERSGYGTPSESAGRRTPGESAGHRNPEESAGYRTPGEPTGRRKSPDQAGRRPYGDQTGPNAPLEPPLNPPLSPKAERKAQRQAERKKEQKPERRPGHEERQSGKDQGSVIDVFYVSTKKTLDTVAKFFGDTMEEPQMCYCPRCGRKYEITRKNSYRFCPDCGIKTKPLGWNQYW